MSASLALGAGEQQAWEKRGAVPQRESNTEGLELHYTSSTATDSCRQQIARDLEVGWTPLPTHARPIFVSLPARPLSDTVVQSAAQVVILAVGENR